MSSKSEPGSVCLKRNRGQRSLQSFLFRKKKVQNLKNFNWIAWFVVIGTKIDVINHRENASYLKLV